MPQTLGDPTQAPVVQVSSGGTTWSWAAIAVEAASDLTDLREYAELTPAERRRRVFEDQVSYLSLLLGAPHGTPIEFRWIWDPSTAKIHLFLLTRAAGETLDASARNVRAMLARLASAPAFVRLRHVTETELGWALQPFVAHLEGAVEIRKRVLTAVPERPDAQVSYYLAVQPFASRARSWEPLLARLAASPTPVVVSTGLEVTAVPPATTASLAAAATAYRRLATPTDLQQGQLYGRRVQLSADAFAVDASELYADALRRYRDTAFRVTISCYSPEPMDDGLPLLLGGLVSNDERDDQAQVLSSMSLGRPFSVVRPSSDEIGTFRGNRHSLSTAEWGVEEAWRPPQAAPRELHPLTWLADPEEAAAATWIPSALAGHLPHFPVVSEAPATTVHYVAQGPSLELGRQVNRTATESEVLGVPLQELTKHALFLGTTGSGKTNSTLHFLRQLWAEHRVPFLVLEPVNSELDDYRWLATQPGFEDLLVLTVGVESVAPFRLNPFEVPVGVRVGAHLANLRACFDAAFGLWDPLPIIYSKALRRTYVTAGFDPESVAVPGSRWPDLRDFTEAMRAETADLDYAGEVRSNILAASILRAESLAEGACASTLGAVRSMPVERLLERPVVLELAGVGDDPKEQSLVMALVLNAMTEHYKATRTSGRLQHVTVIEEAHRLLGAPKAQSGDRKEASAQALAAERFANSLAENRKYGEGLVIVEQDPQKLVPDAYKNTNLKAMHRLPSEEDRRLIGDTMRFTEDQRTFASALPAMQAFVYHAQLQRPALVQVPDVRAEDAAARGVPTAPLADNADLRARHAAWVAADATVAESLAPQGSCGICPSTCWLEIAVPKAAQRDPSWIKEQLRTYPRTPEGRPEWWQRFLEQLDAVTDDARPQQLPRGDRHWRSASLFGLVATSYGDRAGAATWVRYFLDRTGEQP